MSEVESMTSFFQKVAADCGLSFFQFQSVDRLQPTFVSSHVLPKQPPRQKHFLRIMATYVSVALTRGRRL